MSTVTRQSIGGPERLSVATITATLEDMRKHGLNGGLPQEEAFFLSACWRRKSTP